jgi:hypothetical protein
MLLKELIQINEAVDIKAETKAIEAVVRGSEKFLPDASRFKSWDVFPNKREVEWVTQESTPLQSETAAKVIANRLSKAGFGGWKVKVVQRDLFTGKDHDTPWQIAISSSDIKEANSGWDRFDSKSSNYHTQPDGTPTEYDALGNAKEGKLKATKENFADAIDDIFAGAFFKRGNKFGSKDGSDLEMFKGALEGAVTAKHVSKAKKLAKALGLEYHVIGIKAA